jgi:hypothetical protein
MQTVKDVLDSASGESLRKEADRCAEKKIELATEPPMEPLAPTVRGKVEVARSFSFKLNVGNYESRDFFCSQKIECDASEAEALSEQVHDFCVKQVRAAVGAYLKAREEQRNANHS